MRVIKTRHNTINRRLDALEARLRIHAGPDTQAMLYAFLAWLRERPNIFQEVRELEYPSGDLIGEMMRSRGLTFQEAEQLPEVRTAQEPWLRRMLHYIRQAGMHEYGDRWEAEMNGDKRK